MTPRRILFVGGGLEMLPGLEAARRLGLSPVVSDRDPRAPGMLAADERLVASTYDPEATREAAMEFTRRVGPIHGVLCLAHDVPMAVASVADALALPGLSLESAWLVSDKMAMKERFRAAGVAAPWFAPVAGAEELKALMRSEGPPLILKPADSRGARGVVRLLDGVDPEWAYGFARAQSPTGRVMVERYLTGLQVSTESVVIGGKAFTPGFSDRNYELLARYAPHVVEDGGDLPASLSADERTRVCTLVEQAAGSLGITDGIVKGDIVLYEGTPHVIEVAGRLSGGYFCSHEIPLSTGVDLVSFAIEQALGETPDPNRLTPRFERCVSQRYLFPPEGVVQSIEGAERAASLPGVDLCEIRVRVGDRIGRMDCHPARAGVVIAHGDDRVQATSRAVAAVDAVGIAVS